MKISSRVIILIFLPLYTLYSQCCSPGSPSAGTIKLGKINPRSLNILAFYEYRYSDTYYHGMHQSDTRIFNNALYNYGQLNLTYGLLKNVSIRLEQGYFVNRKREHSNSIFNNNVSGLSNGAFLLDYNFYNNLADKINISMGGGIKYPLSFELQTEKGASLPQEVQTSTNAFGSVATVYIHKGFLSKGIRLFGFHRFEYNFVNESGYQYGMLNSTSIYLSKSWPKFILLFQLRNEYRSKDLKNKLDFKDSGSDVIYVNPEFIFTWIQWELGLGGAMPVFRYYQGNQLSALFALNVKIQKDFNFNPMSLN